MDRTAEPCSIGGLEALRRFRGEFAGFWFFKTDSACLLKWSEIKRVELWQGVALHSDVNPDYMGTSPESALRNLMFARTQFELMRFKLGDAEAAARAIPQFMLLKNVERAAEAVVSGELQRHDKNPEPKRALVEIEALGRWIQSVGLPRIGGWSSPAPPQRGPWPWGDHSTPRLVNLCRAATQFLPIYERTKRWDNSEVADWLISEWNVGPTEAEACATFLRPKEARMGRHPKSGG